MHVNHLIISFKYETDNWVIYDGNGSKESTNGTWMLANEYVEITDGMVFKGAEILFKIIIIDY